MSLKVSELSTYMQNGFNILLNGKHGTGKTGMLLQAAEAAGLKVKMFNAASMDVYTDLVGVPKFVDREDGTQELRNVRPREIDNAEVIFIDELNRAFDPKTTNAFFELVQFRQINGEALPKLKCVIGAQNPSDDDEYDVTSLDPALVDRFHMVIDVEPVPSRSFLSTKMNPKIADALVKWHKAHGPDAGYISPRRLEMMGGVFEKTNSQKALRASLPPSGTFDFNKLWTMLKEASLTDEERRLRDLQRDRQNYRLTNRGTQVKPLRENASKLQSIISNSSSETVKYDAIRDMDPDKIASALLYSKDNYTTNLDQEFHEEVIRAMSQEVGPTRLVDAWGAVLEIIDTDKLVEETNKNTSDSGRYRKFNKITSRSTSGIVHPGTSKMANSIEKFWESNSASRRTGNYETG